MQYDLVVESDPEFADKFKLTRRNGVSYTVRGLDKLGLRMRKEARTAIALGATDFLVRDENQRVLRFKPATNTFVYVG